MCMDSNDHPCSFLDALLNRASKSCDDKSCYEEASVFLLNMVPRYGIDDTFQHVTMCIFKVNFKFCSFHKV